jgi:signal transduction histidine kinase/CheY-like chemotaxis protein
MPCFVKDVENGFRYVRCNAAYAQLHNLNENDIIGKTDVELFGPEVAEQLHRRDMEALKKDQLIRIEDTYSWERNHRRTLVRWKKPVTAPNGKKVLLCVAEDVTPEKQTLAAEEFKNEITAYLVDHSNLAQVTDFVAQRIIAVTGCAHVMLHPYGMTRRDWFADSEQSRCHQCDSCPLCTTPPERLFDTENQLVLNDVRQSGLLTFPDCCSTRSIIARQIILKDKPWGMIAIFSSEMDSEITTVCGKMLQVACDIIALALMREDHEKLIAKQQKKLLAEARKQAQQEAQIKNLEARALIAGIGDDYDGILFVSLDKAPNEDDTVIYRINEKFAEKIPDLNIRHRFNRYLHQIADNIVHPDDRSSFIAQTHRATTLENLKDGVSYVVDFRAVLDGSIHNYQLKFIPSNDGKKNIHGLIIGLQNIDMQINQKQTEQVYQQAILADAYYYYKVNLSRDAIVPPLIEKVNGHAVNGTDKLGSPLPTYTAAIIGHAASKLDPEDRENYIHRLSVDYLVDCFNHGDTKPEFTCRVNSDDIGWHYRKYVCYLSQNERSGDIFSMTVVYDVSSEMKAKAERRERQRQLEQNMEIIGGLVTEYTALYHLNLDTNVVTIYSISDRLADTKKLWDTISNYHEAYPKFVRNSVYPDDQPMMMELAGPDNMRRVLRGRKKYSVLFRRNYNGVYLWTEQVFIKFAAPEEEASAIAIGFIEKDKEVRAEQDRQTQLQEALMLAQAANRAKTTFLNNMSHDIRTPMNAIIGFTGLASMHIDNKEQVQGYLDKISQSSDHLLSLINDVLDMSRIESGKMSLNEREEDLAEIVHTLRNIIQADISAKQLELFIDTVDVADEFVVCDKLRLNQILLNITSNAIKYTRPGGRISMRIIELPSSRPGFGIFEFHVMDTGIGMSEDYIKTIFEPFTRENTATVSGIQGTGLGMAITKNIVDMMGGTIKVESRKNEGTHFILRLEFRLATSKQAVPPQIAEFANVRSLVIDDDSNTCLSISRMLRSAGLRSEWCVSGKEAMVRIEEALKLKDDYGVFIIDLLMPDLNGVETVRRIRRLVGPDPIIIIMTAYDWSDMEEEAREAAVSDFIAKPVFLSDLHKVFARFQRRKETPKSTMAGEQVFSGKRILLVEDNELNREIATELLKENGFIVDTAEDGVYAVNKMKAAKPGDYDVILMDVQMPVMDGYEATRQIRALPNPQLAAIPIIAMTANAFAEDKKAALEAGMNEHIPKPIKLNILLRALARFL